MWFGLGLGRLSNLTRLCECWRTQEPLNVVRLHGLWLVKGEPCWMLCGSVDTGIWCGSVWMFPQWSWVVLSFIYNRACGKFGCVYVLWVDCFIPPSPITKLCFLPPSPITKLCSLPPSPITKVCFIPPSPITEVGWQRGGVILDSQPVCLSVCLRTDLQYC